MQNPTFTDIKNSAQQWSPCIPSFKWMMGPHDPPCVLPPHWGVSPLFSFNRIRAAQKPDPQIFLWSSYYPCPWMQSTRIVVETLHVTMKGHWRSEWQTNRVHRGHWPGLSTASSPHHPARATPQQLNCWCHHSNKVHFPPLPLRSKFQVQCFSISFVFFPDSGVKFLPSLDSLLPISHHYHPQSPASARSFLPVPGGHLRTGSMLS